jgi:hypothetical protein
MSANGAAEATVTRVRTHQVGGRNVVHAIEVSGWHVSGWVNGRCLTHGHEGPHIDGADSARTAISVAQACCRERTVPGHQDRTLEPLS